MQKGSKSGGGQGSPDRAAEEQATTRGERGFERASRAEILYVHCLRFLSGPFYIVMEEGSGKGSNLKAISLQAVEYGGSRVSSGKLLAA
jgi:hypothetical protein